MSSFIYKISQSRLVIGRQQTIRVAVAVKLDFFIKLFYHKCQNLYQRKGKAVERQ